MNYVTKKDPQAEAFAKFLSTRKILIADTGSTSRTSIANLLVQMGAKMMHIKLVESYELADQEIKPGYPDMLITDYNLGRKCGLDLLQKQRSKSPDIKKILFFLVTSNASQAAVARAAEEDVDAFILKPFTPAVFKATVIKATVTKIYPSEYLKAIDRGRDLLAESKLDESIAEFKKATTLDPKPSLAYGYLGQAMFLKQQVEPSQGSYQAGLEFNKIHYKCLVGLYEVLSSKNQHGQAYEVVKKISQYFPANPQRLTQVLRLAIITKSYEDVERYYQLFTSVDERNEEMIKYVCASLVVCGKYYLQKRLSSRAIELFQKASATGLGRTKVLREIIQALAEANLVQQAQLFLKKFPAELQKGADYLAMAYLISDQMMQPSEIVSQGRKLINSGIEDPVVYKILVKREKEMGHKDAAEDLVRKATQLWPDLKTAFQ